MRRPVSNAKPVALPATAAQRDLRIDFFKGVALLIVLIDHIEGWAKQSVVETWTLINLGFSDAAEIFIFLSGYVFASAYARVLVRDGFVACLKKASKRALQIYLAYLLAAACVIGSGALLLAWGPPAFEDRFLIGEYATDSLIASLLLCFHPWGFDILAMYVPVLPAMACLLAMLRGSRATAVAAWLLSAGMYLVAQTHPEINLPRFGDGGLWYFNPLAWQFLFFLGLVAGNPNRAERPAWLPRWLLVTLSVAMLAAGLLVLKGFDLLINWGVRSWDELWPVIEFYRNWAIKTDLGPLRLLHFFALAYLTSLVVPPTARFLAQRWAAPLIKAGQHSLEVYAFGLVVSFFAVFWLTRGPQWGPAGVVLTDAVACAVSLAFAYPVARWKQKSGPGGRPAAKSTPAASATTNQAANKPVEKPGRRRRRSGSS